MAQKPNIELNMNQFNVSKNTLKIAIAVSVLVVGLLFWLMTLLHPLPPHTLILATGPEGSDYATYGKRYKLLLAKEGINVVLIPTAGGVDNLSRLKDPHSNIQAAFVEGGITPETDDKDLLSLGTIAYQPLWLFSHKAVTDKGLFDLRGKRVSIGPDGSSSRALLSDILQRNGMGLSSVELKGFPPEQTEQALLTDQVDSAVLVDSLASPIIRKLLVTPGIQLANFSRADAYAAIFPYLTKLELPEGVIDLDKDLPKHTKYLLAAKTSLLIKGNLHPALQYLLLEAASQIHSRHGVFQKAGEFPSPETLDIPLSPDARSYYKSGRPFLDRYLPFWLAALVEQIAILIIPVLGLAYPLVKSVISLYGWGIQRRIYLLYGELHWLELEIDKLGNNPPTEEIQDRMTHLEHKANRLKVSSNYIPMVYSLKETIAYVRGRLNQLEQLHKA